MRYVHAVDRDLVTAIEDLEVLIMKAPAATRRPMVQPSGADVERAAESERRPILMSRGEAARGERQPRLEAGAA